jgi:chromosome segregation ATPase
VKQKRTDDKQTEENKLHKLKDSEAVLAEQLEELTSKKQKLQVNNTKLATDKKQLEDANREGLKSLATEANLKIEELTKNIQSYSSQLDSAANDIKDMRDTEKRAAELTQKLRQEKELLMEQLANKEKDKVIETHKLTINIGKKIEETKAALQDLKKEQLETTRRYEAFKQADGLAEQSTHR